MFRTTREDIHANALNPSESRAKYRRATTTSPMSTYLLNINTIRRYET